MSEYKKFFVNGFVLIADRSAYLVHIARCSERQPMENSLADLPEWMFHSNSAIWLAKEGNSIYQRALVGESMRAALSGTERS